MDRQSVALIHGFLQVTFIPVKFQSYESSYLPNEAVLEKFPGKSLGLLNQPELGGISIVGFEGDLDRIR